MVNTSGETEVLESVTHEKDLGVTIDNKLTFSKHVQLRVNKANSVLGAIKNYFVTFDKQTFLTLYKSLVRPHVEYACVCWSPGLKRDRDTLERVQRRATRLVTGLSHLSYPKRLEALNLPTLAFRRKRADIIQAFKILKGIDQVQHNRKCVICQSSMFQDAHCKRTRNNGFKQVVPSQIGPRKHFFSARVTNQWNALSKRAVAAETVNAFKTELKREWKNHKTRFNYAFSY